MIARVVLVAVSLPVLLWLALSWSNARIVTDNEKLVERQKITAAEADNAQRELDDAERLNPSRSDVLALRFGVEARAGRLDRARAALEEMVREEPEHAEVWLLLASLTRESDPERSAQARARLRELDPRGQ